MAEKQKNELNNTRAAHSLPELPPPTNRPQVFDNVAKAKAVMLRNEGYKYKEIADHLGVNINCNEKLNLCKIIVLFLRFLSVSKHF